MVVDMSLEEPDWPKSLMRLRIESSLGFMILEGILVDPRVFAVTGGRLLLFVVGSSMHGMGLTMRHSGHKTNWASGTVKSCL
mmetsp:Transcript_16400/g.29842  ORF Transcript_16400/g.29842 Transcript_16400/m.29842 type:complete len:82 (-) Transcript_16400:6-251(-)